ncbi:RpsU-divergently transcribed protein [Sulfitobacter noctilucicola]|uniref:Ubiquinone biosynthesis protein COQ9 n=1 Tax=Sulfitobacter noctilucicola TaxID=1342301 RepID=A0A7W6Q4P8_9RHOB|nr:COQ9 family protein [Sulfitobacter noctilucicola]KIN62420.1 RpsU-divergently transcribed protein [Sulfitobacter noctilucicola]MBB4173047.1 ubiquinone biosynthesis protein COQ9 [Sulfitobacter noctilucicola]
MTDPKQQLLDAALSHVPFDGWSEATFKAAIEDTGVDATVARAVCPRGAVDLAVAYHHQGDAQMLAALKEEDLTEMRFRDRIARAVQLRLQVVTDKEAVRRGTTLFALPQYAPDGAKLIWGTSDQIWEALGDTSDDINWYTKRATLSGVYSSTVLFWLGDTSEDHSATWEFLDRRVDNVMQIEKIKAQVKKSPTLNMLMTGPNWLMSQIKAPTRFPKADFPGSWTSPKD